VIFSTRSSIIQHYATHPALQRKKELEPGTRLRSCTHSAMSLMA
jgi:hypothetical protein